MTLGDWVGLVGGLAGLAALGIEAVGLWRNRRPQLQLFVPFHFTGGNGPRRFLFLLVRISNSSERPANLYLETLSGEVLHGGRWYPVSVASFPKGANLSFDLPQDVQHDAGVKNFPFFNKFDAAVVSMDNPFSCYMGMTGSDSKILESAQQLRLTLKDCNLATYRLEAEILKNDPENMKSSGQGLGKRTLGGMWSRVGAMVVFPQYVQVALARRRLLKRDSQT